jgi:hypothetical protein
MSNNRMLALVAILAGGLMVGACGDAVTGPAYEPGPRSALQEPGIDGVADLPGEVPVNNSEDTRPAKKPRRAEPRLGPIE